MTSEINERAGSSWRFSVIGRSETARFQGDLSASLRENNWDDFGFKTLFNVSIKQRDVSSSVTIGAVKILKKGQDGGWTDVPKRFDRLDDQYCSVGQDIEYYENLMGLPEEVRNSYLIAIRDAAYQPAIEQDFAKEPGWQTSLLRFGQAVDALRSGRELLHGRAPTTDQLNFQFDWRRDGDHLTQIPFEFDDSQELPGRCHVLIGYNGVGKTTLLADLAHAANAGGDQRRKTKRLSTVTGKDKTFGAVVAVSYSAFDTFPTPKESFAGEESDSADLAGRTEAFGYVYCGLRRRTGDSVRDDDGAAYELKSIAEIETEFADALTTAGHRDDRDHLVKALEALALEPSFGQASVDLTALGKGVNSAAAVAAFNQLSTGHKIVLNIVAQLAAHLRTRSLVLIDEPETHLHPPLVAALLRAIQVLLQAHSSFAIVATHSPVVVQEIPARYVTILERIGTVVTRRSPEIETFAENIGSITRHVFSLDSSATDYQGILSGLASRLSEDQIDQLFSNGLSMQGRALVANYRASR